MPWSSVFRRRRWESRMDAELRFHLEQQARAYRAEGLSEVEARQKALREFGPIELAKDECRDVRPFAWIEQFMQDARQGARSLRRDLSFSLVALLSITLGIGATTAVFTVVDGILFRSLPYRDAGRLVSIGLTAPMLSYDFMFGAAYFNFRQQQGVFDAVTSWSGVNDCDLIEGEPLRLSCAAVESSFLSTLGVSPLIGRDFTPADDRPGGARSVLLSHALWRSRFAGQPSVLGRTVSLDGQPARIVGVLPANFETPTLASADLLIPQALDDAALQRATSGRPLRVLARTPHGIALGQIQSAADAFVSMAQEGVPGRLRQEIRPRVRSLRNLRAGDATTVSWILLGCVLALLLLSCANVANLLLARTAARQRELAVRAALGAGWGRLIRQALTESLMLALSGAVAGTAFAYALLRLLVRAAPDGIPQLGQAALDLRILSLTIAVSILCALLFGLGPALAGTERSALGWSRTVTGRRGAQHLRHALIVAQISLSLALLTGAGLLIRTFSKFQLLPLGMETQQIAAASLTLSLQRYPTPERQLAFAEELERRLVAVGGFSLVAISDSRPPAVPLRSKPLAVQTIDGRPQPSPAQGTVVWRAVTPSYFRTLGIRILAGRGFSEEDRAPGSEVMIVSQSLARRLFPASGAVGHFIGSHQVVGVAADVRNSGGTARDDPEYYVPREHDPGAAVYNAPDELRRVVAIVRSPLAPEFVHRALRAVVAGMDAGLPVQIEPLEQSVQRLSVRPRFNAMLLGLFALIGLLMAAFGVYGVLGFLVTQRTREIGVRIALGAAPAAISALILGNVARWLTVGLGCGMLLSLILALGLRRLLFGVSYADPVSWLAAAAALCVTSLLAAWQPARRALSVDPMETLRNE